MLKINENIEINEPEEYDMARQPLIRKQSNF